MDDRNQAFFLIANRMLSDKECKQILREKESKIPDRTLERIKYKYQMDARSILIKKQKDALR